MWSALASSVSNAVATSGTATTPSNVQRLLRMADASFSADGDNAGRKAAWRALESALEHLADNRTVAFLFLPAEHDPDSFVRENGAETFQRAARSATRWPVPAPGLVSHNGYRQRRGARPPVPDARPLVTRIAAPMLRLQVIRSLAGAGMMQRKSNRPMDSRAPRAPNANRRGTLRRGRSAIMPRRKPSSSVGCLHGADATHLGRTGADRLVPDDSDRRRSTDYNRRFYVQHWRTADARRRRPAARAISRHAARSGARTQPHTDNGRCLTR